MFDRLFDKFTDNLLSPTENLYDMPYGLTLMETDIDFAPIDLDENELGFNPDFLSNRFLSHINQHHETGSFINVGIFTPYDDDLIGTDHKFYVVFRVDRPYHKTDLAPLLYDKTNRVMVTRVTPCSTLKQAVAFFCKKMESYGYIYVTKENDWIYAPK